MKDTASGLLEARAYPRLFQEIRNSDSALYFSCLLDTFAYRKPTPVYARLLHALKRASTISILTTNVDESLERNLTDRETVQRSDVERIPRLLAARRAFICKLPWVDQLRWDNGGFQSKTTTMFGRMAHS